MYHKNCLRIMRINYVFQMYDFQNILNLRRNRLSKKSANVTITDQNHAYYSFYYEPCPF